MKTVKFKNEDFLPSLSTANSVVLSKCSLPILSYVRIETKLDADGVVYAELMTSDSETWMQIKAPLVEAQSGTVFCVESKSFFQALRNIGDKDVTLKINEENHTLKCDYGNGHFTLPYDDANDFPMPICSVENSKSKMIDSKKMLTAIEKVVFAAANDELRPVMNGVRFEFFTDGMVSVASDGQKLIKYKDLTITNNDSDQNVYGFIMPQKPCSILINVLNNTIAGNVNLEFNDSTFTLKNAQFKITARLIDGRYPNYDSVIPKDNNRIVCVPKIDFVNALKRVLPMSNSHSELVSLSFSDNTLVISAQDYDFNKSASENVVCDYSQDSFSIGFKGSLLLQLLQNIDTENVKLMLKDPSRAGLFCEDKQNSYYEYTSILMPMLIQN